MKSLITAIVLVMLFIVNAHAWEDARTHPQLSEYAAEKYFGPEYLSETINEKSIRKIIRDGAKLEDEGVFGQFLNGSARSLNHFHDPTKTNLDDAGLNDIPFFIPNGMSALLWAQNADYQKTKVGGDWSWQAVRNHYYNYLISTDNAAKNAFLADQLKGLGYQMHLIQDMSQPNHVRDDTHILDGAGLRNGLETWAAENEVKIQNILEATPIPIVTVDLKAPFTADTSKSPVANLFDTRNYIATQTPSASLAQGLAEYTNANFFSENTAFAAEGYSPGDKHYFPHPRKDETNLQTYIDNTLNTAPVIDGDDLYESFTIAKQTTTGEKLDCLATPGFNTKKYLNEFGEHAPFYRSFKLEETCYEGYASKLIPLAVGYSKAMLDYFFRGNLNITAAPGDITFRSVKVTVANSTPNEAMRTGEVALVIRYKALTEVGSGPVKTLNYPSDDYSFKVVKLQNVDLLSPRELTFDFSNDPLPINYSDMTMQFVYKGKLGNEEGAVAVSEPNVIDGIYTDFDLSLPQSGVYAKTSDDSPTASFNELRLTALSNITGGLSGGTITLALDYRTAIGDQFQSVPVDTNPDDAAGYIFRAPEKNGVNSLPQGVPVELVFDLSLLQLPVQATDVEINIIYTNADGTQAIGVNNISEPTPVDVYNNTDYTCLNGTWYHFDDPAAITLANQTDINPHIISNISFLAGSANAGTPDASVSNTLFTSGPLATGQMQRLGYILADYANRYAFNEIRTGQYGDSWPHAAVNNKIYTGTGFRNDATAWSSMFTFRNADTKMWWGTSVIFVNKEYPLGSSCTFDALNQKLGL